MGRDTPDGNMDAIWAHAHLHILYSEDMEQTAWWTTLKKSGFVKTFVWSGDSHLCAMKAQEIAGLCSNQSLHQWISLIRYSSMLESVKSTVACLIGTKVYKLLNINIWLRNTVKQGQ